VDQLSEEACTNGYHQAPQQWLKKGDLFFV
jgi:hypothetical protein